MGLSKLFLAALFLALTVTVANAYTIVMRDGRRVEIPNKFTVTKSKTLTYEVASGIQITIQLDGVDVAATERANGEPKGALLLRASTAPKVQARAPQKRRAAERSITNRDLETYRQKRIQNELAYEKRRKELGLPTPEERRLELAAIQERTREQLLSMRSQEQASEEYWRDRASSLRTEMKANQAQIDYVRRRLDEIPLSFAFGSLATTIPFGTVATPVLNFPFQNLLTPNVFAPSLVNSGFSANIGVVNTRVNMRNRRFPVRHNPNRFNRFPRNRRGFSPFVGGNLLAVPFESFDASSERAELVSQLNELEMDRAGLKARFRELEEEARRAGAYPGWLRP